MILRSVCIWALVFVIWSFLMSLIVSYDNSHEQRLAEIEKEIMQVRSEYEGEQNHKSRLLKQHEELSKKIEHEIERGESAKLLLGANVETESPSEGKMSTIAVEKVVTKQVVWDQTPAEQVLEIGDWVTIEGYQDAFIGASIRVENGINYGLEWTVSGLIDITSQPTALSAPGDGIHHIIGSIDDPRGNEIVVRINEALLYEETVLIRVTGQIYQLNAPHEMDRYPNQWGVILKQSGQVEFME